jgi:D-alanine-D-alanine ligase
MAAIDVNKYGRLGILYGGVSAEREISLESGRAILDACERLGFHAIGIDVKENVIDSIQKANLDTAFIALHGGIGEDGRLQSLLNFMGISYTGSDVQSSVLAMNKLVSKQMWLGMGLPTPEFSVLDGSLSAKEIFSQLGNRVMVKPAHEGSSIGMGIAETVEDIEKLYKTAAQYDRSVLAEQLLPGPEYTVAILDRQVLPPIKLETSHGFYDYDAKYLADDTRYICPCGLDSEKEEELKELSLWAFDSLQCSGWGRVDVMVNAEGQFNVLEVNTVPGMTSHSLVPMAAKAAGISFDELVARILMAVERD